MWAMASGSDTRTILGMARKTVRDKKGNIVSQGARKTALSGPQAKRSLESRSGSLARASRRLNRKGFRQSAEKLALASELERVDAKDKRGSSIRSFNAEVSGADEARAAGRIARGIASGVGFQGAFGDQQQQQQQQPGQPQQPKGPSTVTGVTSLKFDQAKGDLSETTSPKPQGVAPTAGAPQTGPAAPAPTGVGPKPSSTTSSSTSPVTQTAPSTPVTPVPEQPTAPTGPAAPAGETPVQNPAPEPVNRRSIFGLPAALANRQAEESANVSGERTDKLLARYKQSGLDVPRAEAEQDARKLLFRSQKREILNELRGFLNNRDVTPEDKEIARHFEHYANLAESFDAFGERGHEMSNAQNVLAFARERAAAEKRERAKTMKGVSPKQVRRNLLEGARQAEKELFTGMLFGNV